MTAWKFRHSYTVPRNQTARRSCIHTADQKTNMDFSGMSLRNTLQQKDIHILHQTIAAQQVMGKSMNGPTIMIGALATPRTVCMAQSFCAARKVLKWSESGSPGEVTGVI